MLKYVKIDKNFCFLFLFPIFLYMIFSFALQEQGESKKKKYIILMFFYVKLVKILDFIDFHKFDNDIKLNVSL